MKPSDLSTTSPGTPAFKSVSATALLAFLFALSSPSALARPPLGVYEGNPDSGADNVNTFTAFAGGHAPDRILDFLAHDTWDIMIGSAGWTAYSWSKRGYPGSMFTISIPIGVDYDQDMGAVARGERNDQYTAVAQQLASNGLADAVIRIGWEMNGGWYYWNAIGREALYAEAFRQVVTAMRKAAGQNFKFDWCINSGGQETTKFDEYYPGEKYVDIIGMDAYGVAWGTNNPTADQVWASMNSNYSLDFLPGYAASKGKDFALDEWGVGDRFDGSNNYGPGDNVELFNRIFNWIDQNKPLYTLYWDFNETYASKFSDGERPRVGAAFLAYFNGQSQSQPSAPPQPPAPPGGPRNVGQVVIQNQQNGMCLDQYGTDWKLSQWNCVNSDNQKWDLLKFPDGSYSLRNPVAGKCIDVWGDSRNNGDPVGLYDCSGSGNQKFWIWDNALSGKSISGVNSGKCLDGGWFNSDTSGNMQYTQWDCWGGQNQSFNLNFLSGGL